MSASVGYGNWSAGYLICDACAKDPDPRGWTGCAGCRELNPRASATDPNANEPWAVKHEVDALHAEIRSLNNALTEALARVVDAGSNTKLADVMRARYGRECEQWKANHEQRKQERDALAKDVTELRAELLALRSMPFIPIADHRRACDARDAALAQLDALTAKVQRLEDARGQRVTDEALRLLAGLVRQLEKTGGYSLPHEQSQLMEARALLAECK